MHGRLVKLQCQGSAEDKASCINLTLLVSASCLFEARERDLIGYLCQSETASSFYRHIHSQVKRWHFSMNPFHLVNHSTCVFIQGGELLTLFCMGALCSQSNSVALSVRENKIRKPTLQCTVCIKHTLGYKIKTELAINNFKSIFSIFAKCSRYVVIVDYVKEQSKWGSLFPDSICDI